MNPSTAHAQVIVDELVRGGVTDAVLCPGSRSAPLAFALHAADAAGRLRLHVRIDERTAGFLALGLALRVRAAGAGGDDVGHRGREPAPGRAGGVARRRAAARADRGPAAAADRHGGEPDVVQAGIFGDAVRPRAHRRRRRATRSGRTGRGASAVDRARRRGRRSATPPGPVHLTCRSRSRWYPTPERRRPGRRRTAAPWTAVVPWPRVARRPAAARPGGADAGHRRGGGPGGGRAAAGLPVIAEPASRRVGRRRCAPVRGCSARSRTLCSRAGGGRGPPDPAPAGPAAARRPAASPSTPWRIPHGRSWTDVAGHRPRGRVRAVVEPAAGLDGSAGSTPTRPRPRRSTPRSTPRAHPAVCGWPGRSSTPCPAARCSSLGSSNPVRDLSLAAARAVTLTVLANRGVAGIDGTVSTAVGAACPRRDRRTRCSAT